MVNLICQLGLVTECRYAVKHYSVFFCEGVIWMRLTFKLVESE